MTTKYLKLFSAVLFILIAISVYFHYNIPSEKYPPTLEELRSEFNSDIPTIPDLINPSMLKTLLDVPFKKLQTAIAKKQLLRFDNLIEKLILDLTPFIIMEPKIPINTSCLAPKLHKQFPQCLRKSSFPKKIGVLLQFGFDVDTLEIHLNELYEIVDRFFILESTRTLSKAFKKPLIWESVKGQSRFEKFADKVVHLVVDDSDTVKVREKLKSNPDDVTYDAENIQERLRWEKFVRWNKATNFFGDEDLLGFGDTDEIPSRDVINRLKYCEEKSYPVDIGIWFPYGNIKNAFRTDYQVGNYTYSLGDPTYWTLKSAKEMLKNPSSLYGTYPSRNRGMSPGFLLGGMHMSHYGYLPLQIIKRLSTTEADMKILLRDLDLMTKFLWVSDLVYLEQRFAEFPIELIHRLVELDSLGPEMNMKEIAVLPWFYNCNRIRFPAWQGGHDSRLD